MTSAFFTDQHFIGRFTIIWLPARSDRVRSKYHPRLRGGSCTRCQNSARYGGLYDPGQHDPEGRILPLCQGARSGNRVHPEMLRQPPRRRTAQAARWGNPCAAATGHVHSDHHPGWATGPASFHPEGPLRRSVQDCLRTGTETGGVRMIADGSLLDKSVLARDVRRVPANSSAHPALHTAAAAVDFAPDCSMFNYLLLGSTQRWCPPPETLFKTSSNL